MTPQCYSPDWFLGFYGQIPAEQWCAKAYADGQGGMCAMGHCIYGIQADQSEAILRSLHTLFHIISANVWAVNDGTDPRYQQPSPKQRVLQALADIKSAQEAALDQYELRPLKLSGKEVVV